MALYTQKFIAADYLAKVQTQTHFFQSLDGLLGTERGKNERRGLAKLERREERDTQLGKMKRRYSERESESFDDGCGSPSFPLILPLSPFCRLFAYAIRSSPRLNLAETGDFSAKTCSAFYCQIDHLNNSQHSNPSPTSVVLSFSSCSLFSFFLCSSLC